MARGQLSITRATQGDGPDYIMIATEEDGGARFMIEVDLANFAEAMTGKTTECSIHQRPALRNGIRGA